MNKFWFICARLILNERGLKILSATECHSILNDIIFVYFKVIKNREARNA